MIATKVAFRKLIKFNSINSFIPKRTFTTTQEVVSFYDDKVTRYSEQSIKPVTLKKLLQFGQPPLNTSKLLESAQYTKSELPVRLAQITKEETDIQFAKMLAEIVSAHTDNIPVLARGFQECKKYMSLQDITEFLDDMIRARIAIRLIAEQHIALHNNKPGSNYIGIIDINTNPIKLIKSCANFVKELCEIHYGTSPDITINGQIDITFTYVSVHLEYIISEILKNSYRATVEYSRKMKRKEQPNVEVTISRGNSNNVGIRVKDQGGGISPKDLPSIFDYSFTTVPQDETITDNILADVSRISMQTGLGGPIAGLGYGLPLARIYAQYFGGSLSLMSLYGHGCDVFLRLNDINESFDNLQI
ncbi:221_t:CDS:2 [Diversispora eburnea]|uniref:Protein-serine/threonine kinase n=1 Tax=Diversispora eburnea TaxID=1213867 RepID=A0A9N9G297_9GLOM|nr:221_t:CDS:2 [Diversispora eburnea]